MARQGFNRIPEFRHRLEQNKLQTYYRIGRFCKGRMDYYVPVDTGFLQSNNEYKVTRQKLTLINDCPYAGYVHQGTSKMIGRPFMTQAVFNHLGQIQNILLEVYRL